jgi:hypothetical protein
MSELAQGGRVGWTRLRFGTPSPQPSASRSVCVLATRLARIGRLTREAPRSGHPGGGVTLQFPLGEKAAFDPHKGVRAPSHVRLHLLQTNTLPCLPPAPRAALASAQAPPARDPPRAAGSRPRPPRRAVHRGSGPVQDLCPRIPGAPPRPRAPAQPRLRPRGRAQRPSPPALRPKRRPAAADRA